MPTIEEAQARLAQLNERITQLEAQSRFSGEQLFLLMDDLAPGRVSSRTQGGSKLSYVEAHDIKNMMIRIFGFAGFSSDVLDAKLLDIDRAWTNSKGAPGVQISAMSTVRVSLPQYGVTYTESAVSVQAGTQGLGDVADFAIKTASSDAFKRAAIFLGTQFGLSLYADGSHQDQVRVLTDSVQQELLLLTRERKAVTHFIASMSNAPAVSAPQTAPSTEAGGPTPRNGAQDAPQNPMQAAFQQGQS